MFYFKGNQKHKTYVFSKRRRQGAKNHKVLSENYCVMPVTYQSGPGDASQRHQAEGAGQGQPSVDPDTGLPVTHQSGLGDTDQHYQAEGAGQSQLLAAGEEGACKARQQGKMEFLTTQELDREAQQTTDQVGGSLERER